MDAAQKPEGRKANHFLHSDKAGREFRLLNVELTSIVSVREGVVDIIGKTRGRTVFESAGRLKKKARKR